MSSFSSDKCTKEELFTFKLNVIDWLYKNFPKWKDKFKIKAFCCYGGDIRLYDGTYQEFPNLKSSFRRGNPDYNEKGEIIGWTGTRGVHTTRTINYISINRDEFNKIKKAWEEKKGDDYLFWDDFIFRNLK
jgi:hypothetical protein